MEWKEIIRKGTDLAKETSAKLQDKETQQKVIKKVADTLSDASQFASIAANDAIKKTKQYVEENHMTQSSKDKYIQELEQTITEKDKEIRKLKRMLAKKNWKR